MATRFYLVGGGSPVVSPAFDSSWEVTGSAIRRILSDAKTESGYVGAGVATSSNTPAGSVDVLIAQFVSAPLSGSGTISGAIKGYLRAQESSTAADLRSQCVIRVVTNDGSSVVGTLVASDGSALASEWTAGGTYTNRKMPLGSPVTPSSVAYSDGDRIVVEMGYRKHENATSSRTGWLAIGAVAGGTDAPENETDTTSVVGWIEFADTLSFQSTQQARVSQAPLEGLIKPTSQQARVSQAPLEALMLPTTQLARVSQAVVEVLYPSVDATAKARVSQAVVEVLYPSPKVGRSWGQIL